MNQTKPKNSSNIDPISEPLPGKNPGMAMKDTLFLLLSSGLIITLDTWTKELVNQNLFLGETWLPERFASLRPYLRIIHLQNKGTAFGLFHDENQINLIIMVIAIVASLFIIWIFPRIEKNERALRAALIFQLAGAVGNLISRIRYGYVLDFISVGDFPVFNIADSSITIGLGILILGMIMQELKERNLPPPETDDSPEDSTI
jgi:signal peptidase II